MDVPPPPPPLPLQVGEQTPEHFRVIREDAKRNQEEHNARIERRTARALEGMNALEAGELALLKLVEPEKDCEDGRTANRGPDCGI